MIRPGWLAAGLAVMVLGVAAFSAARLVTARGRHRRGELDGDVAHLLMGVAMAGMLLSRLRTMPAGAWDVVFAGGALWFGWRAVRAHRDNLASRADQAARPTGTAGATVTGAATGTAGAAGVAGVAGVAPVVGAVGAATGSGHSGHAGHSGVAGIGRRIAGACCRHPLPHLIDCLAMLFMLWSGPALAAGSIGAAATAGMGGMDGTISGARLPALVLALCVCGYVVWLGDRVQLPALAHAASGQAARGLVVAPRLAACCKIAMGVAMGVMLIDLI